MPLIHARLPQLKKVRIGPIRATSSRSLRSRGIRNGPSLGVQTEAVIHRMRWGRWHPVASKLASAAFVPGTRRPGLHLTRWAQQGLDTSTTAGNAMFQMLGVFAEFERGIIRERVNAGLARAKAKGVTLGRRRLEDSDADKVAAILAARAKGSGIRRIARELGVGVGTVLRVTGEAALATIGPSEGVSPL
jgi:DNA invertase Pin-like site-specific DNA recombinase